ncbi:Hpt domain-containing protein [Breoghania sp.]|uniref:Hpt domain-containing protein n=1 Tax=Breoghania sp. TaxID=2065378 RepID=UPI002AAB4506|nr:Hpt domain-containing protein [Breoghania sp.]
MSTPASSSVSGTDRAPVDLAHLARHTFGDQGLQQEVLALFESQSAVWMDRLKQAGDVGEMREAAHSLKGSARGIGAWQVAELAERLEADSGEENSRVPSQMARVLTRDLEDALAEVNQFIRTFLEGVG